MSRPIYGVVLLAGMVFACGSLAAYAEEDETGRPCNALCRSWMSLGAERSNPTPPVLHPEPVAVANPVTGSVAAPAIRAEAPRERPAIPLAQTVNRVKRPSQDRVARAEPLRRGVPLPPDRRSFAVKTVRLAAKPAANPPAALLPVASAVAEIQALAASAPPATSFPVPTPASLSIPAPDVPAPVAREPFGAIASGPAVDALVPTAPVVAATTIVPPEPVKTPALPPVEPVAASDAQREASFMTQVPRTTHGAAPMFKGPPPLDVIAALLLETPPAGSR